MNISISPRRLDLKDSKNLVAWTCHGHNTSMRTLNRFIKDGTVENYANLKGAVLENLGILVIMLAKDPTYLTREFGETSGDIHKIFPENRIDLVEIRKGIIRNAWEIKKTLNLETLKSDQIANFKKLYNENFWIVADMVQILDSQVIFIANMILNAGLESKITNFLLNAIKQVNIFNPSTITLNRILLMTESVIDQSIYCKNPGRKAHEILMGMSLDPSKDFSYVYKPKFNASILAPSDCTSVSPRIIQTSTTPHLLDSNYNSTLEITIKSTLINCTGLRIQVCFSTPTAQFSNLQRIQRNMIYTDDEILNYLEPIRANRSTNLNFWNFLNALNLDFLELARTRNLVVEVD